MQGFIVTATTRIWQLAAINLCALGLCVLGLGVLGAAPALVAASWATARLDTATAGQLVVGMWGQFRAEFVRANVLMVPHGAFVACLVWLGLVGGGPIAGLSFALAFVVTAHLLAGLFALSRLSGTVADGFANARLGLSLAPYGFVVALVCVPFWVWIVVQQPLLGVYFGLSGFAWLVDLLVFPSLSHVMPTPNTSTSLRQESPS